MSQIQRIDTDFRRKDLKAACTRACSPHGPSLNLCESVPICEIRGLSGAYSPSRCFHSASCFFSGSPPAAPALW